MPDRTAERGRPRSSAADAAILGATRELLAEGGYEAVTMEAVAARAGVGKTTVYRRHPSRSDLVVAAVLASLEAAGLEADRGGLRAELEGVISGYSGHLTALMTEVSLRLAAEAVRDERTREAINGRLIAARREAAGAILARAAERGELARPVHPDTLLDLIGGAVLLHAARHGEVDAEFSRQLLDIVVTGLTTPQEKKGTSP